MQLVKIWNIEKKVKNIISSLVLIIFENVGQGLTQLFKRATKNLNCTIYEILQFLVLPQTSL